jgi:chaperone modulatory protein CbpM
MITIDVLMAEFSGLARADLERWIANRWVRPQAGPQGDAQGDAAGYRFREIDVARIRLILELRDEMQIDEDTLPVVLSLLDQLYDERRRLRELCAALEQVAPEEVRRSLAQHLAGRRE